MVLHLCIETGKVLCIKKYASSPSGVQPEIGRGTKTLWPRKSYSRKSCIQLVGNTKQNHQIPQKYLVLWHFCFGWSYMNRRMLLNRMQDYEVLDAGFVFCRHEFVKKEGKQERVVRKQARKPHTNTCLFSPYHLLASEAPNRNFRWFHTEHFSE